jgi:hypothetical protein
MGVSSKEKGVYPPRYSSKWWPLTVTLLAVMTPPKSANTRFPFQAAGARKWRR